MNKPCRFFLELNPEKIVPYKDVWMVSLNGEFQHFQENDNEDEYSSKYFPNILEVFNIYFYSIFRLNQILILKF